MDSREGDRPFLLDFRSLRSLMYPVPDETVFANVPIFTTHTPLNQRSLKGAMKNESFCGTSIKRPKFETLNASGGVFLVCLTLTIRHWKSQTGTQHIIGQNVSWTWTAVLLLSCVFEYQQDNPSLLRPLIKMNTYFYSRDCLFYKEAASTLFPTSCEIKKFIKKNLDSTKGSLINDYHEVTNRR